MPGIDMQMCQWDISMQVCSATRIGIQEQCRPALIKLRK